MLGCVKLNFDESCESGSEKKTISFVLALALLSHHRKVVDLINQQAPLDDRLAVQRCQLVRIDRVDPAALPKGLEDAQALGLEAPQDGVHSQQVLP
jgi:hypothetical protein